MTFRSALRTTIVVFMIATAGYGAYWVYARNVAERIVLEWIDARRDSGYRIEHEPIGLDGFPFLVRATFANPLVAPLSANGDPLWIWRGGRLTVESQPWRLDQIRVEAHGGQTVTMRVAGREARQIHRYSGETVGVVHLMSGHPQRAALTAQKFIWRGPGDKALFSGRNLSMWAVAPKTPPKSHQDPLVTISISGADLVIPPDHAAPFGPKLKKLIGVMRVLGRVRLDDPNAAIEAWRRDGGAVDIDDFRIVWGPLDLKASGTLALDEQTRPLGAFSADIRGFTHVVDSLAASGIIETGAAAMAKISLGLLAKPAKDGGPPVLSIPLTAQNGRLYAGPLKILDLPPLPIPARLP
jgi:hypothetical protein